MYCNTVFDFWRETNFVCAIFSPASSLTGFQRHEKQMFSIKIRVFQYAPITHLISIVFHRSQNKFCELLKWELQTAINSALERL